MKPLSRRAALTLGGLGVAGTVVGGAGLLWSRPTDPSVDRGVAPEPLSGFADGQPLREPPELRSVDGLLEVRLEAAQGPAEIGGRTVTVLAYNEGLPGPTLRLRPGDRLRVRLRNGLADLTNLHVHGLHVSPEGNSDNPFVMIEPGAAFDYDYRLPGDHPPGLFWYHPHHHGLVADQVFGGLYGAILIDDPEPVPVARERVLVISDLTPDGAVGVASAGQAERMRGREGRLVLVNGQLKPRIDIRPGERERWRIVNACVSRYLRLSLDGLGMQLLGLDSGRFETPRDVEEVLLAPGNRADLLVTAATSAGGATTPAALRALPYDRGSTGMGMGGMMGGGSGSSTRTVDLATVTVSGEPVAAASDVPRRAAERDLRGAGVTARRELAFAMGMGGGMGGGGMSFTINGEPFDGDRVDTTVQAGGVEEWLLSNSSPMDHPVHLHVWPMQLIERNGRVVQAAEWQDVVNVPAGGTARVRIAFDDFPGRTVYHCHILDHEDLGMMGVIDARGGSAPGAG
ncbi:multicopper oxidase family protein [Cryobacterium sinapicolor]|uniref:Multicopper oxidase family protein n=1 Tax=Cryobacterium sinapicolor TaxID=1259236 RepID=A0ABY2JDV5_9MICO|nr:MULTISPECIES: multicopper oxidase family protein [Cryobacterium]TFC84150.1 multicopper oxidase family protein [Cryobacterium sp. TMT3-29-2]TFD02523.1 multicopper oxidase family protein [Cryobacterium sinapicolor]